MPWTKKTFVENVTYFTAAVGNNIEQGIQEGIEVAPSRGAPVISNPGARSSAKGVPTELQINATNATSYAAVNLPAGLTINAASGRITGTPTTEETVSVTVTVNGPGGSSSIVFSWTITAVPTPTVSKPADQVTPKGTPVELQVVATETEKYEATGLPAGLSINEHSGLITGTPTTEVASKAVKIKVTAPGGATKEAEFKWEITAEATLPAFRAGEPKVEGTGTELKAASPENAQVGDLLLLFAQAETNTATITTPSGWTRVGTLGNTSARNFYIFWAVYTGQAMPTIVASTSTTLDLRTFAVQGGNEVNVNSGWKNQGSATKIEIASVTTTSANELAVAITCKPGGQTETTPAGWTQFNTKQQFRVFTKHMTVAEETGATETTLGGAEVTTAITFAVKKTGAPAESITEKLSGSEKGIVPETLPVGTVYIGFERSALESGAGTENEQGSVPAATEEILGTVAMPWVRIVALNATYEYIGNPTLRLKTTPEAKVPVVAKPPAQSSVINKAASSLQIVASESPTSYGATGLPTGLSINTSTGLISGTPTVLGTKTVKVKATNGTGASAEVAFEWTIASAPTLTTGLNSNADAESAQTLAAIALGPPALMRADFGISTAASSVKALAKVYKEHGTTLLPIAGFSNRLPSASEAKGLKAWAEAIYPEGCRYIEFGNETNYSYQLGPSLAVGETYGTRAREAAEAMEGTGVKLLVQGSDADQGGFETVNGIFKVWPGIVSHPNFGGWTIHPYPSQNHFGESDVYGQAMLERMVSTKAGQVGSKDTTSPIWATEWGEPSTASGVTLENGHNLTWAQAASILETMKPKLEAAGKSRLVHLSLYQAHDQKPEGSTSNEAAYGALTSSGGEKGAFTAFVRKFL